VRDLLRDSGRQQAQNPKSARASLPPQRSASAQPPAQGQQAQRSAKEQTCAAEAVFTPTCGAAPYSGAGLQGANVLTMLPLGTPDLGGTVTLQTTGLAATTPFA
jgi:hypothetical protein